MTFVHYIAMFTVSVQINIVYKMNDIKNNILKKALLKFEEITGREAEIMIVPNREKQDADIVIPNLRIKLHAEVKPNVTNQILGAIVHQLKLTYPDGNIILVTRYITPQLADKLKNMHVKFIDTVGNAYIDYPNMFIFVKGNKAKEGELREKPIRAFQPAGLQFIYALLCNPGLENQPYRIMANAAGIANGAITWAMKDLKKLGYVIDMGKRGRRLVKKNELLQRWIQLYAELLRPKLIIGRYRTDQKEWWQQEDIANLNAMYGGETAAALTTKYLKPQNHVIYTAENNGKLLYQLRLKTDPKGDIELLKKFWHFNGELNNNRFVNPILIYADLLITGDERNIETANLIYDKEIIRYIKED